MKSLSEKVAAIASSATMDIADQAKRMAREGIDVISLSIGEPDFDTPSHIKDACCAALARGETHYAPSNGIPELIQAISEKCRKENGFSCRPEEVIATCGAKHAIYLAMEAVINAGEEAILIDPAWVSYEPCIQMAGGRVRHYSLNPKTFQVDDTLAEKISQKTRMIVVNTPSNPAGTVFNTTSLSLVADLCEDYDLIALSDEIYEKLVYEKEHISLATIGDMVHRTITINGFSKAYAMTGWRLGYSIAPLEITRQMLKVQQHSVSHPTTFVMWGGVAALKGDQACVNQMRTEFDARRKFLMAELPAMGFEAAPMEGAFYSWIRVPGDDMEIARRWLEYAHVAVTPGSVFYAPGWIRLSYATALPRLREAMTRIANQSEGSD
ncbi:MAG: pyridoxal phosphate-dependent aminotransferase [Methanomicrobiales archaeon]|nr:pyridoxal phosphate-dependent aminotransferase [Methanomicrobiales archaeon]